MLSDIQICAIDPGRSKSGLALFNFQNQVVYKGVIKTADLPLELKKLGATYSLNKIVVGAGTFSGSVVEFLKPQYSVELIDEKFSTLEARRRYWQQNPPHGWKKFIPRGLLVPPQPYDDFAAVILGERYLRTILKRRLIRIK